MVRFALSVFRVIYLETLPAGATAPHGADGQMRQKDVDFNIPFQLPDSLATP